MTEEEKVRVEVAISCSRGRQWDAQRLRATTGAAAHVHGCHFHLSTQVHAPLASSAGGCPHAAPDPLDSPPLEVVQQLLSFKKFLFLFRMSKIVLAIAALALCYAASCNAEVLVLKSPQDLQDAIAAHPRLVVKFYAPW